MNTYGMSVASAGYFAGFFTGLAEGPSQELATSWAMLLGSASPPALNMQDFDPCVFICLSTYIYYLSIYLSTIYPLLLLY